MNPLVKGGQQGTVQVGNIDLLFKVTDMLLQHMDLVLKLTDALVQVKNYKHAHIWVLAELKGSSGTHWRWGLNRGSRQVSGDPVWLA